MKKIAKFSTLFFLLVITSTIFVTAFVSAQDEPVDQIPIDQYPAVPNPNTTPAPPTSGTTANVVVAASVGGTTNPTPGNYIYNQGATINLQATPSSGYKFAYWTISGSYAPGHNSPPINYPENAVDDPNWVPTIPSPASVAQDSLLTATNPLKIICGYGYTFVYQPVFVPTTATAVSSSNDAVVTVLQSLGGASNPTPGTYQYSNGSAIVLKATADSGYTFQYWVATGSDGHPTTIADNPTNINCGYGYTYTYQPMFAPSNSNNSTSANSTPSYLYAIIVVLAIIAVAATIAAVVFKRNKK
jgi:hypothetical protein